eukprot:scaffold19197_cov40-Cyclotella_meneghiniana.AAC.4
MSEAVQRKVLNGCENERNEISGRNDSRFGDKENVSSGGREGNAPEYVSSTALKLLEASGSTQQTQSSGTRAKRDHESMSKATQGVITEEEANRIRGLALNCEGSSLSTSEAEFRKKVWLALAPLCEETSDGTWSDDSRSKCGDESVTAEGPRAAKRSKVECDALKRWYDEHESNPYPTKEEKAELMMSTGLAEKQINNWFATERLKKKKARGGTTAQAAKLSEEAVEIFKKWYDENEAHPYPTKEELRQLALRTELTDKQVHTWFKSERTRRKKAAGYKFKSKDRLPTAAVSKLKKWYDDHESHPYPTKEEHKELLMTTELTKNQINDWFVHERLKRKKAAGDKITPNERLPTAAVSKLKKWYDEHKSHPFVFPTKEDFRLLALTTELTETQVSRWFVHERAKKRNTTERALHNDFFNEGRLTRVDLV